MHRYSLLTGGSVHLAACVRVALYIVHLMYLAFGEVCPQEANNSTTYVYIYNICICMYIYGPPFL